MPCAPAASPHGPVTSRRPLTCRVTAAVAVAVAAGALAACGSSRASTSQSAVEKPDLTVAAVPASGAAGLYIAQQDGYFTAAGLHVTIVPVASGGDVLANLVNGSIDVDEGQWTSAIAAQAAGVKLHALAAGNAGGPGVQEVTVPPGSGITTVKQLAGKTIAVNALAGPDRAADRQRARRERDEPVAGALRRGAVPGHGRPRWPRTGWTRRS